MYYCTVSAFAFVVTRHPQTVRPYASMCVVSSLCMHSDTQWNFASKNETLQILPKFYLPSMKSLIGSGIEKIVKIREPSNLPFDILISQFALFPPFARPNRSNLPVWLCIFRYPSTCQLSHIRMIDRSKFDEREKEDKNANSQTHEQGPSR